MSKNLEIRVSSKTTDGTVTWEGTVSIPGTRPTKLVRSTTGTTAYNSRASLLASARTFAKRVGFDGITEPAVLAKAAKKSVTATKVKAVKATNPVGNCFGGTNPATQN